MYRNFCPLLISDVIQKNEMVISREKKEDFNMRFFLFVVIFEAEQNKRLSFLVTVIL